MTRKWKIATACVVIAVLAIAVPVSLSAVETSRQHEKLEALKGDGRCEITITSIDLIANELAHGARPRFWRLNQSDLPDLEFVKPIIRDYKERISVGDDCLALQEFIDRGWVGSVTVRVVLQQRGFPDRPDDHVVRVERVEPLFPASAF